MAAVSDPVRELRLLAGELAEDGHPQAQRLSRLAADVRQAFAGRDHEQLSAAAAAAGRFELPLPQIVRLERASALLEEEAESLRDELSELIEQA